MLEDDFLPCDRGIHIRGGDELHLTNAGELALDANTEEVRVITVGIFPLLDLLLIGEWDRAGIDLDILPGLRVRSFAEALAESAGVAGGIAVDAPDDLGVGISEDALGGLPDDVRDGRGFVEDQEDSPAFVVQPREGFSVLL